VRRQGLEHLVGLGEAARLLLREDERIVGDDVELALGPFDGFRPVPASVELGRETRGPAVVAASDGAVEDANGRHAATLARAQARARQRPMEPDGSFGKRNAQPGVRDGMNPLGALQLRVVVNAPDYDDALRFYRDVLGLPERAAFSSPGGRVTILEAGGATLELADPPHADYIDEVEVGRRVAGHIRICLEVADVRAATATAAAAGASVVAGPTETPWRSVNARLEAPAGLQLTLFEELGP
jgi:catechol 2,3-dioxygenase-like lactoylglutathione lyase family enzyme